MKKVLLTLALCSVVAIAGCGKKDTPKVPKSVGIYQQLNLTAEQNKKLADITTEQNAEEEETLADEEAVQKGIIVDLGDFILNLNDQTQKKYLKVNVALELTRIPTDYDPSNPPVEKKGGHGGHGGGEEIDPMKMIEMEMAQYKPAIRDAVITNFSSKTADEVLTSAGKEIVKEQITEDVNAIFAGEREVIRVSFGQFIIQ